jgi:hypothetical protein
MRENPIKMRFIFSNGAYAQEWVDARQLGAFTGDKEQLNGFSLILEQKSSPDK